MPELPEVETTRIGITPYVIGKIIEKIIVRQANLRWPVPTYLDKKLCGQTIHKLDRRAKYLLFHAGQGCLIMHLGMSGSLRILSQQICAEKHDHVDLILSSGNVLRYRDPRRFGCVLWSDEDPLKHSLLKHLGPEPLDLQFDLDYLFKQSRSRKVAVKNLIMDSRIVAGVGNIYANESLFIAGIRPTRPAGKISRKQYALLVKAIKKVLTSALEKGGTTLRDFTDSRGKPGYFHQQLKVYQRAGKPCKKCQGQIKSVVLGQRSTFYCANCQT